jgi:hypothetical protein
MSPPDYFVRTRQLGTILGLTERRISDLVKLGVLPSATPKGYRLIPCVTGYIAFLKKDKGTISDEKVKLLVAKRQLLEMDVRQRQGELIEKFQADQDAFTFARRCRDVLLSIPDRTSGLLAAESDQWKVYQMLEKEIHQVLCELSGAQP